METLKNGRMMPDKTWRTQTDTKKILSHVIPGESYKLCFRKVITDKGGQRAVDKLQEYHPSEEFFNGKSRPHASHRPDHKWCPYRITCQSFSAFLRMKIRLSRTTGAMESDCCLTFHVQEGEMKSFAAEQVNKQS